MFKIFFVTFFMAELIIAIFIIVLICRFDRHVNNWNKLVISNKKQISNALTDLYLLFGEFVDNVFRIKEIIKQKRMEYLINFFKTVIVYCGIFMLRGKYKKAVIVYQLAKEIYEGISEAEV